MAYRITSYNVCYTKLLRHTFDFAWYQNVLGWLTITPGVRYYSQGKADFYETVLPSGGVTKDRSSDYLV